MSVLNYPQKDLNQTLTRTWRSKWQPTPVLLPGEFRGQRSLVGCCSQGRRVGHDSSDLACMHALEKEMATPSSVLAWRIPGTEEPGGLPSMGSHRVGRNKVTQQQQQQQQLTRTTGKQFKDCTLSFSHISPNILSNRVYISFKTISY